MILYIARTRILVAVGAKLSASCWRRRIRLNNIDVDAVRSDSNRDRSSPPRPMDCYCIAIELRERSRWRGLISDLSSFRLEPSYCVLSGFAAIAGVVRCDAMGDDLWNVGTFRHRCLALCANASSHFCGGVKFTDSGGISGAIRRTDSEIRIVCVDSSEISFMV